MDTDKMNLNELEQANGGDFIDDVKDVLKKLNPFKNEPPITIPLNPEKPEPIIPDPVIARRRK